MLRVRVERAALLRSAGRLQPEVGQARHPCPQALAHGLCVIMYHNILGVHLEQLHRVNRHPAGTKRNLRNPVYAFIPGLT